MLASCLGQYTQYGIEAEYSTPWCQMAKATLKHERWPYEPLWPHHQESEYKRLQKPHLIIHRSIIDIPWALGNSTSTELHRLGPFPDRILATLSVRCPSFSICSNLSQRYCHRSNQLPSLFQSAVVRSVEPIAHLLQ